MTRRVQNKTELIGYPLCVVALSGNARAIELCHVSLTSIARAKAIIAHHFVIAPS